MTQTKLSKGFTSIRFSSDSQNFYLRESLVKWPRPSGRGSVRTKAKTYCHIIFIPYNHPSGIFKVKQFAKLLQRHSTLIWWSFIADCSVAPLLKCLRFCSVRQATRCENSVFHELCFGKRYWPDYLTQIALQAGGKKGGVETPIQPKPLVWWSRTKGSFIVLCSLAMIKSSTAIYVSWGCIQYRLDRAWNREHQNPLFLYPTSISHLHTSAQVDHWIYLWEGILLYAILPGISNFCNSLLY